MTSITPSIPSSFFCTFSVVYLGNEERALDREKDQAAIEEAAASISIPQGHETATTRCVWGVSEDQEWAVMCTYAYFEKKTDTDSTPLSLFVHHAITCVRDMIAKDAFAHIEKGTLVDDKLIPCGPIICSALFSFSCKKTEPTDGVTMSSRTKEEFFAWIDASGNGSRITNNVLRTIPSSCSCFFYPTLGGKNFFLVIFMKEVLRKVRSSVGVLRDPDLSFGQMDKKELQEALADVMQKLKRCSEGALPKSLPPLDSKAKTKMEEGREEAKAKEEATMKLAEIQKEVEERLAAAKAAFDEMETAIAKMEEETKEVEAKTEELKRELTMKALRKDGLDVDRKKLEAKLKQSAFRTMKPSASTSLLDRYTTKSKEPVGLRGLLDARKPPCLTTTSLAPMSLKHLPPIET